MFQAEDAAPYTPLRDEQWLGDPNAGDFDMGVGQSTSQLQNPNVNITANATAKAVGAPGLGLYTWLFAFGLLVAVKLVSENAGKAEEFRTVRVGLENLFLVGTMSALWFMALKLIAYRTKWAPLVQFAGFI
jgi:hypothetical protein